ncbi:glycosyltransferase [Pontiellaceae bacterium B12227]|nr:glycosyltransferase [Pontiellaceae bacterium B12227]
MIVVCDINEVWRKKPFAALAEKKGVLGVSPRDWFVARRQGKLQALEGALHLFSVVLPPSWASRLSGLGQRILWKKIVRKCKALDKPIDALVVTSPHYLPMLSMIPNDLKTIYYASDDYRSYEGWGGVAALEKKLVERVDHSFFVSDGLMQRARKEYGVDSARLSVSMNATEERFFPPFGDLPGTPPEGELQRPIAGVVGGINDRLDFNILKHCAELPGLGTLLLVGPLPAEPSAELQALLDHPKCVSVGRQPHETIHKWFQCLDVGLIPYVSSEFNRMCSPMRLFDHLASGAPVVATRACDQCGAFGKRVSVCVSAEDFAEAVQRRVGDSFGRCEGIVWEDRAAEMVKLMEGLDIA